MFELRGMNGRSKPETEEQSAGARRCGEGGQHSRPQGIIIDLQLYVLLEQSTHAWETQNWRKICEVEPADPVPRGKTKLSNR